MDSPTGEEFPRPGRPGGGGGGGAPDRAARLRPGQPEPSARPGHGGMVAAAAYVMLFLVGVGESLIGCFQYSQGPGVLVAVCLAAGILAICLLGAWGMHAPTGALAPAIGWVLMALALSAGTSGGSIVITDTAAGKWFLFGGAAGAAIGCVYAFAHWFRVAAGERSARFRR